MADLNIIAKTKAEVVTRILKPGIKAHVFIKDRAAKIKIGYTASFDSSGSITMQKFFEEIQEDGTSRIVYDTDVLNGKNQISFSNLMSGPSLDCALKAIKK